jgi:hypothetical protein
MEKRDIWLMQFQVFLVIVGMIASIVILTANVIDNHNLIVSISNGLTTSSSVMIAGSAMLLTYSHSSQLVNLQLIKKRLYVMIALMFFSATFIFFTYNYLMIGEYVKAIKIGMFGLLLSFLNFSAFAVFTARKLLKIH